MSLARLAAIAAWLALVAVILLGGHAAHYAGTFETTAMTTASVVFAALVLAALAAGGLVRGIGSIWDWCETAAHAVPLTLFLVVGPASLNSLTLGEASAFTPREDARPPVVPTVAQSTASGPVRDAEAAGLPAPKVGAKGHLITDLLEVRYFPHLQGGKVELIGKIGVMESTYGRRKGQSPTLRTVLFRHVMTCCAADAQPITADLANLPEETPHEVWVRVRGSANARETPGQTPVIHVDSIERVDAPESPYLDYRGPGAEGPPAPGSS